MSVRCDIDLKGYLKDASKLGWARDEFAEKVVGDFRDKGACGNLVPRRSGKMQDEVTREGDEITWDKHYAVYVWERNVSGQAHWFFVGAEQQDEAWRAYAAQAIREGNVK